MCVSAASQHTCIKVDMSCVAWFNWARSHSRVSRTTYSTPSGGKRNGAEQSSVVISIKTRTPHVHPTILAATHRARLDRRWLPSKARRIIQWIWINFYGPKTTPVKSDAARACKYRFRTSGTDRKHGAHLVVTATPRVQLLAGFPGDLGQSPLVRGVDVLVSSLRFWDCARGRRFVAFAVDGGLCATTRRKVCKSRGTCGAEGVRFDKYWIIRGMPPL